MLGHPTAELLAHDVGDDPLAGAVVDEVHDVAEDQEGLAGRRQTGESLEFAVHVGDDEHA